MHDVNYRNELIEKFDGYKSLDEVKSIVGYSTVTIFYDCKKLGIGVKPPFGQGSLNLSYNDVLILNDFYITTKPTKISQEFLKRSKNLDTKNNLVNVSIPKFPSYISSKAASKFFNQDIEAILRYVKFLDIGLEQEINGKSVVKLNYDDMNALKDFIVKYPIEKRKQMMREDTCLRVYNSKCAMGNPEVLAKVQKTLAEEYGDPLYPILKMREACKDKFGCEFYMQSEDFHAKARETKLDRYSDPAYNNRDKCRDTFQSRYNANWVVDIPGVKEKIEETKLKIYGGIGVYDSPILNAKAKETCIQKFGYDICTKNPEIINKIKQTNLKNRGVEWISQDPDVRAKMSKSMRERENRVNFHKWSWNGMYFDSKWEVYYYVYLLENNINFDTQVPIKYKTDDDNEHIYYCDFKLIDENRLVEIKNPAFIDSDGNLTTIFRRTTEDDISWNKMIEIKRAKSDCMRENNVQVITDISEYKDWFYRSHSDSEIIKYEKPSID